LIAIIAAMPNCETWLTDFWDEIATAVALKAAGRINERD
jgi:Flp pilus assembly pilin Flp